jgi:predicted alpha/beta-fold hydrolase
LAGFSLGGNLVLKYAGEEVFALSEKIKAVMAVSAPIDLYGCVLELSKRKNILYEKNFLKTLKAKTLEKAEIFTEELDKEKISNLKKLYDFDDVVTGPLHGFEGARDYYSKCNSLQFIPNITIPSLLLTAHNDPFLSDSSYPYKLAENHPFFHLQATKYGGHCGFHTKGKSYYWGELELLRFAQKQIQQ